MKTSKFIKAYCDKTNRHFAMEAQKVGSSWRIVNVDTLPDEKAKLVVSQIRQDQYDTHTNLLPCRTCGSRRVGGCGCAETALGGRCSHDMKYDFQCVYCRHFHPDHSLPSAADVADYQGDKIEFQGKEVKVVTFSNVVWTKFDKIPIHAPAPSFPEPSIHVAAMNENIEFHGYNISAMNEGVFYTIGKNDDFEIECDVNTTTISPHPGGYLYIEFGILTAHIDNVGGYFFFNGNPIAQVGSRFNMRLSRLNDGHYLVYVDGQKKGEKFEAPTGDTRITFGFAHDSHCCALLSHAYLTDIRMVHIRDNQQNQ